MVNWQFHVIRVTVLVTVAWVMFWPVRALTAPPAAGQPRIVAGVPEAFDFKGVVMAPMEATAQALGANVVVTGEDIQATLPGGNSISVRPDGTADAENPTDATPACKPLFVGATVYVRLLPLIEALGAKLERDDTKKLISITLPGKDAQRVSMPVNMMTVALDRFSEDGVELYALRPDNRSQLRLSYGWSFNLEFAQAAETGRLVYCRNGSLYWRDLGSPTPHLVLEAAQNNRMFYSNPNVTPDGKTIYCARQTVDPAAFQLSTTLICTGIDGAIAHEWEGLSCPRLSANGLWLAYTRLPKGDGDSIVGVLDTRTGQPRDIGAGYHPVFSQDATRLLFTRAYAAAQAPTAWALATCLVSGPQAGACTETPPARRSGRQLPGGFSPDGKYVVCADPAKGILLATAALEGVRQLTAVAGDSRPCFSPDGKVVYFVRDENIYAVKSEGGEAVFVTSGIAVADYQVASGGKYLLCTGKSLMPMTEVDNPYPPVPDDFPPEPVVMPEQK